jgi:hypothetical protein
MGHQLFEIYSNCKKELGLSAVVKLAMLTKISVPKAIELPDSPELLDKIRQQLEEIRKQENK